MSEAVKHSQNKPPIHLINQHSEEAEARALAFGAQKYGEWNWAAGRGLRWTDLARATIGHVRAFLARVEQDPESGLSHIDHAKANLGFLAEYIATGTGQDDRRPARGEAQAVRRDSAPLPLPESLRDWRRLDAEGDLSTACWKTQQSDNVWHTWACKQPGTWTDTLEAHYPVPLAKVEGPFAPAAPTAPTPDLAGLISEYAARQARLQTELAAAKAERDGLQAHLDSLRFYQFRGTPKQGPSDPHTLWLIADSEEGAWERLHSNAFTEDFADWTLASSYDATDAVCTLSGSLEIRDARDGFRERCGVLQAQLNAKTESFEALRSEKNAAQEDQALKRLALSKELRDERQAHETTRAKLREVERQLTIARQWHEESKFSLAGLLARAAPDRQESLARELAESEARRKSLALHLKGSDITCERLEAELQNLQRQLARERGV